MSVLLLLLGCSGNNKHTADNIVMIHTAYHGMERNPVYSFALLKKQENWLFSACCYVNGQSEYYTSFSSFPIPADDAEKFLEIIREEGEIKRLRKYRNPIRIFHASDAPMRSSGITFSDGSSIDKESAFGDRALKYLYALADKYYEAAESIEVTTVSVNRRCMDYSSSYSFTLEKNENAWYFSFDAVIDGSGVHTEVERQMIDEHDAKEILRIIEEQQLVTMVRQYEEPPDDGILALDETLYGISFGFSDGSSINAPIYAGEELREAFYTLATVKIHQR